MAGENLKGFTLAEFSVASTQASWDGHINRTAYVNAQTTPTGITAGGHRSAPGAAPATFSS